VLYTLVGADESPSSRALAAAAVPCLGAAAAKPLQISILRADEVAEGVVVATADGAPAGRSRAAGRRAVALTVATRVIYLAPMLWIGAMHAAAVRALPRALAGAPGASAAALVAVSAANSAVVTPAVIALFDARASARAGDLEPHIAAAVGRDTLVYFNKGI